MCKTNAFTIDREKQVWNYEQRSREKIYHS